MDTGHTGPKPPDGNPPATKDHPIVLSADSQSDVEMNEPAAAANIAKSAPSPSLTGPPAPHQNEAPMVVPTRASPAQGNGTSAPSPGAGDDGGGGHISPSENKERTTQPLVPKATRPEAAAPVPIPAAHYPQAAQAPQPANMNAPTPGTPSQHQQRPNLSQQVSNNPAASLSSVATMPHPPTAQMPPANQAPRAPSHISPPHQPAPTQSNGPRQSPGEPFSRSTASPALPQSIPFREPHTPSALDPYTMENLFTNGGFHLPDSNDSRLPPEEYVDQCNRLYAVVRTMNPSVVRRVIRDTWQSSLAGSEAHISFVMNVVTHKCNGAAARTAIDKFGKGFVNHAKWEILSHFTPALLAETEDLIVEKAPDSLLDKAMAKRLVTISPRPLLNMLARAERLGYDESDIIDEGTSGTSKPTVPSARGAPHTLESRGPSAAQAQPRPVVEADPHVCPLCHKRYPSIMTRDHHFKKRVCQKSPASTAFLCSLCDQSFATKAGLDYHRVNKVCGGDDTAASPAAAASPNVMVWSAGNSPASSTPPQSLQQARPPHPDVSGFTPVRPHGQSTPHTAGAPAKVAPIHPQQTPQPKSAPPPASQASLHDPYAHLSKEQYNMLEHELIDAEMIYASRMEEVRHTITDPVLQQRKLNSLKNSFATKQSTVRKKYGVKLRERRSKVVLDQQKMRMQGFQGHKTETPPGGEDAHASKKARGVNGQAVPTQMAVQETPTRKHAASADVAAPPSGGLAASSAAPEMVDPTKSERSRLPLYTNSGSHATPYPASSQASQQFTPVQPPSNTLMKAIPQRVIEVGGDTESDTDSDDDTIPAQLPPPPFRPRQGLGRPR